MAWYKMSKNFDKRNIINHKIIFLNELKETLRKLSKLVFQSGKNTKIANFNIVSGKKITSYPELRDLLLKADSCVLDNPWKFAGLCEEAVYQIEGMVWSLEDERELFTLGKKTNKIQKGWVNDV